ncbi:Hypothetical protein RY67_752 [Bifidobacterium longum subsp. infantis]|uniref:Uncharacterized protein n=1 Tax=Bifidobacterium longum subsp. infantis TaxID=1682 RepID=A0A0M4LQT3_BIFLI|nr:Hypothetical protein RY67_752 [Bifidobacterium longum subsp. infantis]
MAGSFPAANLRYRNVVRGGAAVKVGNGNPVHVRSSRIGRAADESARSASP